jgi:hypothetical protein
MEVRSFIQLAPGVNFIKLFWHNLRRYRHIALRFDSGYAATGANNAIKRFMKLTPGRNFIKLITSIIY